MFSPADLQLITSLGIFLGLIFFAALIVLVSDWRVGLYALTAHYASAAFLLLQITQPSAALIRVISGGLAALILYLTARQTRARNDNLFISGFAFRLFALAFVIVSIVGIASSMTFLNLTPPILFGGLFLIAMGALIAILSREILRLGVGILVFTSGFCILETATESSLLMYGLLNVADLLLALVIAHLAKIAREDEWTGARRGEWQ